MSDAVAKIPSLINSVITAARPKFNIFLKYTRVKLAPPKLSEIPQIKASIGKLLTSAKSGAWKNQASLNALFRAEVIFWFYVRECIGHRNIVAMFQFLL